MKLKTFLCVLLVACFLPFVATAADKNNRDTTALDQLKNVDKNSNDAATAARAGREQEARDKAKQGWPQKQDTKR